MPGPPARCGPGASLAWGHRRVGSTIPGTGGRTGAVSLRMSQLILLMDISTMVFAFAMGLRLGWPLLLLAVVSGSTKLIILWLFRWERRSAAAEIVERRDERGGVAINER